MRRRRTRRMEEPEGGGQGGTILEELESCVFGFVEILIDSAVVAISVRGGRRQRDAEFGAQADLNSGGR
eukprot:2300363-Pyramimonas_sp.AAC.1